MSGFTWNCSFIFISLDYIEGIIYSFWILSMSYNPINFKGPQVHELDLKKKLLQ